MMKEIRSIPSLTAYEARLDGFYSRGAADRCHVQPTEVTSQVWGGRTKDERAHV